MLESLFNKIATLRPAAFLKRESNRCFPVTIANFLRTPFLKNICEQKKDIRTNYNRKKCFIEKSKGRSKEERSTKNFIN